MSRGPCARCGRSLNLVSPERVVLHRQSTGFGQHNERVTYYCGVRCRALAIGRDPVIDATRQLTLAPWIDGVAFDDAAAVTHSVDY